MKPRFFWITLGAIVLNGVLIFLADWFANGGWSCPDA